jgi:peptidoglycan/xylan/chitin deacetylase (PgdA/CDA1 family)
VDLSIYRHGKRNQSSVALTFDDGPNPTRTEEVIDILDQARVRATFFVIGKWVSAFPATMKRLVEAGHVIGNHSDEHRRGVCDFDRARTRIERATGKPSAFLRVPYFAYQPYAPCLEGLNHGTRVIDADVRTQDYLQSDPATIAARVLDHPQLRGGSIIVLHDGSDTAVDRLSRPQPMILALPSIIAGLKQRGLTPVGLDELAFGSPHHVQTSMR